MLKPILLLSILASFLFANIPLSNNRTNTYLIDTNTPFAQVITESKEDGTTGEYTYGNDLIYGGSYYFLTDALGSTRGLVDSDENLTDSYDYKPYGEIDNHIGTSRNLGMRENWINCLSYTISAYLSAVVIILTVSSL
jgi:hypothetical protein